MKGRPEHPAAGKAVIYVRLSGQPYGNDPFSPENQRRICRRKGLWKRIRPFGYLVNDGRLAPHPTEAPIVRGMVDSFVAGSSLRGIAKGLNAQGVKPPRLVFYEEAIAKGYRAKRPSATSWSYVAVRGILTAPALAALISHGGEPCRDEHGLPIFAGVGIVDLDERSQILEELRRRAMSGGAPRATRGDARRDTQPKYLLTGFGRCGPTRPHSLRRVSMGPDQRVGGPLTGSASRAARRCHSGGLGLRGRCPARSPRAHRLDR